ncbi:MAG: hypothetical protein Q4A31_09420 [Corynebacterium sp.]|uniref:hypothetical protein n=1 Tax=Corynebacterium sp. TaxID=1720 RepID=UPI0026DC054A|nr:hypothetical protein [Corynebacterium sp.]MDO4762124.1 hypothetical protein [Corynebacterium sp.]
MSTQHNDWDPPLNLTHAPVMPQVAPQPRTPKNNLRALIIMLVVLVLIAAAMGYLLIGRNHTQDLTHSGAPSPTHATPVESSTRETVTVTHTQHVRPPQRTQEANTNARFKHVTIRHTECPFERYIIAARGGYNYFSICEDNSGYTYQGHIDGGFLALPATLVAHNEFHVDANPYTIVVTPSVIRVIAHSSGEVVRIHQFTDWETKN